MGATLKVDGIEATFDRLRAAGVEFTAPPEEQPWGGTLAGAGQGSPVRAPRAR